MNPRSMRVYCDGGRKHYRKAEVCMAIKSRERAVSAPQATACRALPEPSMSFTACAEKQQSAWFSNPIAYLGLQLNLVPDSVSSSLWPRGLLVKAFSAGGGSIELSVSSLTPKHLPWLGRGATIIKQGRELSDTVKYAATAMQSYCNLAI
jgi:hypothetical protein